MAQDASEEDTPAVRRVARTGCIAASGLAALLLLAFAIVWLNRESIADNIIADALAAQGIEASYEIESIGPKRQVLSNIVVGDPAGPDLTIERATISIEPRFGFPHIDRIRLERPLLRGSYRNGVLSFGALDPVVFAESEGPFELPDLNLAIARGGLALATDHGPVGVALSGSGNLRNGFTGQLAMMAADLSDGTCRIRDATLQGGIAIRGRRPSFEGPARLGSVNCANGGPSFSDAEMQLAIQAQRDLAGFDGNATATLARLAHGTNRMAAARIETKFTWHDAALTAGYDISGRDIVTQGIQAEELSLEGSLRALRSFRRVQLVGSLQGRGLLTGPRVDESLASLSRSGQGTLLGPITGRIREGIARQGRTSRLDAQYTARLIDGVASLVVPSAILRGGNGTNLINLSRFQLLAEPDTAPVMSAQFVAGGLDLPRIEGQLEQGGNGTTTLRMAMAPYAAGDARISVPELVVRRRADGALGFAGEVRASGAVPGGRVDGLVLPLSGNWSPSAGLAMWRDCTDVRFESLSLSSLALDRRSLQLCAPRGSSILRYGQQGLRIAAGLPSLEMTGHLGETAVALNGGPVGIAYPGTVSARTLSVTLGPAGSATRFAVDDISARIGSEIAGTFSGADIRLYSVPLDLLDASGEWRFADGRLMIGDGAFRLEDRQDADRFQPLTARNASLTLADNRISADARLRARANDAEVVRVSLAHDLGTAAGHADLDVGGLTFGPALQPAQLTDLALGVVANVKGTVTGTGRIDWNENAITSTGRFSTDSLDLAAAFGPVRGASGTIEFTDLIGMTTAPDQVLDVVSINPGIEVFDGVVRYSLTGGEVLNVESGVWPFMGGTLTMRPVTLRFGAEETRSYIFDMQGLQAGRFVEQMELNNIGATGTFDGTIPVVFDRDGNGALQGGALLSRPPGGNVSYVGELTYEDLSPMANYAFDMLRSLDYREMRVAMDGPLTGEIVTRVRFEGVRQGEGAKQNFLTRRIAKLPIRFLVNVRAPFYSLISSVRAIYDPAAIRDPRDLGLLDSQGNVLRRQTDGEDPIQPRASEDMP